MSVLIDSSARGSDVARSRQQAFFRALAEVLVSILRLNGTGPLATETAQKIAPVCRVTTRRGPMLCRAGHGRLVWRARTFYTEEPETVAWLDQLTPDDVLWDIGANVGLYSLYAAKTIGCRVLAFEPEAQNFALLMENIALNGLSELITPTNLAVGGRSGIGHLVVHAMTKGGAYNQFVASRIPEGVVYQMTMGATIDDLVKVHKCPVPTHIKIDVDGIEPDIIAGAAKTLRDPHLKSLLVELRTDDPQHMATVDHLASLGFVVTSRRSNWESRENRSRESEYPLVNVIVRRENASQ